MDINFSEHMMNILLFYLAYQNIDITKFEKNLLSKWAKCVTLFENMTVLCKNIVYSAIITYACTWKSNTNQIR